MPFKNRDSHLFLISMMQLQRSQWNYFTPKPSKPVNNQEAVK